MVTLYRIYDIDTGEMIANGMDANQAHEMLQLYQLQYPECRFEIESYQQSSVKPGFGRDPDLH